MTTTKEQLEKLIESHNEYDPKTLAWKLLVDDIGGIDNVIMGFSPDNNTEDYAEGYFFEILIIMFMEMFFGLAVMMHEGENESQNKNNKFKLKMEDVIFQSYFDTIHEKFKHVKILSKVILHNVNTLDNNGKSLLKNIVDDRYCRIILKDCKKDSNYFAKNKINENYHIIFNELHTHKTKLNDINAIIIINNKFYQIYFDKF